MMREYRITAAPFETSSFSERLALQMIGTSVWPFKKDDRISILMTALGIEILPQVETDDQIEAVLDQLRIQMKLAMWRNQL
jgi:hypothetical protein